MMRLLTPDGIVEAPVPDEAERTLVGRYWNAVDDVLRGEGSALRKFKGATVAGRRLESDPVKVTRWAKQGELDFEDIYESA